MSNGNPQVRKPDSDDPLIISAVKFHSPVSLGGHGTEDWTVRGIAQNQYHGKSRVEYWQEKGVRFLYKAGTHYEEHKVPWSNIADITEVPMSALDDKTREMLERMRKEIVR